MSTKSLTNGRQWRFGGRECRLEVADACLDVAIRKISFSQDPRNFIVCLALRAGPSTSVFGPTILSYSV